ncbi:MAG: inositol monophosphatase family protein [Conexivisphaerales archaeon]
MQSLTEYLEFLHDALMSAQRAVMGSRRKGDTNVSLGIGYYGDETFQIDKDAEDAVIEQAYRYYKKPVIITEERGVINGDSPYILVDPVDGSTNARRDISVYATAIAVAEDDRFNRIKAAGVIDHVTGRIIWGSREAVYEDWRAAKPSKVANLQDAVVAFDSKLYRLPEKTKERVFSLVSSTKYPRILSTAALETAYVATGRLDAYVAVEAKLRTFDCLPSLFLLKEARGYVNIGWERLADIRLTTKDKFGYIAAANEKMLRILSEAFNE